MLAQLSQWILIATLSQAPQEADWLKVIPADVDVAIHVRGLDAVRNDAVAMIKAMSPEWGKMVEDGTEAHLAQIREKHGEHALKAPWVGMIRLGDSDVPGGWPMESRSPPMTIRGSSRSSWAARLPT